MNKSVDIITQYNFFKKITSLEFVDTIWLFGSRARQDNQDRADIDLAIDCNSATQQDWFKILDIIDEADTLLKIDCVRFDSLSNNSKLKDSIISEGIKIYDRKKD